MIIIFSSESFQKLSAALLKKAESRHQDNYGVVGLNLEDAQNLIELHKMEGILLGLEISKKEFGKESNFIDNIQENIDYYRGEYKDFILKNFNLE